MALATRCPHCKTTFRVAHDQLKLRAGLVRCGACKEIFNGVEHLLRPEEMEQVLAAPGPEATPPQAKTIPSPDVAKENAVSAPLSPEDEQSTPAVEASRQDESQENDVGSAAIEDNSAHLASMPEQGQPLAVVASGITSSEEAPADPNVNDPLQRMTLMDVTAFHAHYSEHEAIEENGTPSQTAGWSEAAEDNTANTDQGDEISQAIDDLKSKPWRRAKPRKKRLGLMDDAAKRGKAEPRFMAHARRQKRYGKTLRIAMGAGSGVLFAVLLLQGVFAFRDMIAAKLPQYRPILTSLCVQVGCQVQLPTQIDKVSIESSELQSLPSSPSKFTLVALLRNQATIDQAWPHLELTLNDANEKPVARKVFRPGDYLVSPQVALTGFPHQSEQQIRISFEMLQLKASGYRLYLFYP